MVFWLTDQIFCTYEPPHGHKSSYLAKFG